MVTTLPGLLLNTLSLYPKPQFMLVKKMGHYTPISSAEFGETVRHYALATPPASRCARAATSSSSSPRTGPNGS